MKRKTVLMAKLYAIVISSLIISGCDMTHVLSYGLGSSASERAMLEGAMLRVSGLPSNLQEHNILRLEVANTASAVARIDAARPIRITHSDSGMYTTAYIPLIANNDQAFIETGWMFIIFDIRVDALTYFVVDRNTGVLVHFSSGRGSFDIGDIPDPSTDGRTYLAITNLPSHVQVQNVANVSVYTQAGVTGRLSNFSAVRVQVWGDSATMFVPLSYSSGAAQAFSQTGYFYISFEINIDAVSRFVVERSFDVLVRFLEGNASFSVNDIPDIDRPDNRTFLAITSLPSHVQWQNITNVDIWNHDGIIGRLRDYSGIDVRVWGDFASAYIPLTYANSDTIFSQSGTFFVSFDINVDAVTHISVSRNDGVLVDFFGGNASLDILDIPERPNQIIPYLTIVNLPLNTVSSNFSEVFLYNMVGRVARAVYADIIITPDDPVGHATARIPLAHTNGSGPFRETGQFFVSFTVNVDAVTQIVRARSEELSLQFSGGFGSVTLASHLGYFSGGLVNAGDGSSPVIRGGSRFEMNRSIFQAWIDTPARRESEITQSSLAFVYAVPMPWGADFIYSTDVPHFDPARNGYYRGNRRALFKFIYLKDVANQYIAKTFISDPWPFLHHYALQANTPTAIAAHNSVSGLEVAWQLSGLGNPWQTDRTLPSGAYIFVLRGAGGGAGGSNPTPSPGSGGAGGFVAELVIVEQDTTFSFFTGQGGGRGSTGGAVSVAYQRTSGGGGGSGSSVRILPSPVLPGGYLLFAGGGGGGAGAANVNNNTSGVATGIPSVWQRAGIGGGGAGGAASGGGGGGGAGFARIVQYQPFSVTGGTHAHNIPSGVITGITNSPGAPGGAGGGRGGGAGGSAGMYPSHALSGGRSDALPRSSGYSLLVGGNGIFTEYSMPITSEVNDEGRRTVSGRVIVGTGGRGGSAAFGDSYPGASWDAPNVGGTGGQADTNSTLVRHGGDAGNNRNTTRGGGALGIASNTGGARGGDGVITVYRIAAF